jgi:hypothetical protein
MTLRLQLSIPADNSNIADFRLWAGDLAGLNFVLTSLGFTKQADTFTAQWANAITIGAAALPNLSSNLFGATCFPATTNLSRSPLASTNFKGAWVSGTSYVAGNVVTDTTTAALVYINILATSGSTAPVSDATHWSPYYMEIWKTGGLLTPIYMKLEYGCSATAANPQLSIQFGTGWAVGSSGYLTGNVSLTEQLFNGSGTIATTECDFCADGNNFFVANIFRGGAVSPGPSIFGFERSINGQVSAAPNYTSDYLTYVKGFSASGNWWQQTMYLSGSPVTAIRVNYANTMTLGAATASLIVNNTTPAFPVFPLLGYCGNPMTILIAQQIADTTEGAQQTCTVYGAVHNYLMTKTTFAQAIGGTGQTTSYGVGTRFDAV